MITPVDVTFSIVSKDRFDLSAMGLGLERNVLFLDEDAKIKEALE